MRSSATAVAHLDPPLQDVSIDPGAQQWMDLIPDDQWSVYREAIAAARTTGLPFMLGGGFALAAYTGRWRNTKDIDFYIMPGDRDAFVEALTAAGFSDYYDKRPYDRGWIYRSVRGGVIVDIIWSMANRRSLSQYSWFEHAQPITVREEPLTLIAAEELLWCKMYVMQRDHSDWPDSLNLLYAVGPDLDWRRIIENVHDDLPVLRALLTLFAWVAPARAAELPATIKRRLNLASSIAVTPEEEQRRVRLLDTRNWFAALCPIEKPLEI